MNKLSDTTTAAERVSAHSEPPRPAFTLSATARSWKEALAHSGFLQVDLDHLGGTRATVRAFVQADPHLAFGFVSPSGQGLKRGVRIDGVRFRVLAVEVPGPDSAEVLRTVREDTAHLVVDDYPVPADEALAAVQYSPLPCHDVEALARRCRSAPVAAFIHHGGSQPIRALWSGATAGNANSIGWPRLLKLFRGSKYSPLVPQNCRGLRQIAEDGRKGIREAGFRKKP